MGQGGGRASSRRPSLPARARSLAAREGLLPTGCRVLVMVSGGQDSVALLEIICRELPGRLRPRHVHVLHVNHHLRAEESDADQALVEAHCRRLGVEFTVAHRPVEKAAGNVQARARDARRAAALEVAGRQRCDRIALGHTADDQVENLLYRIGRYGGVPALRGMLPLDPPWVRPLLEARREETAHFCRERGLAFAVDRGNAYPGYARTGIREQVVPAWEAVLPGSVEAAARTAEVAAEVESLVGEAVAAAGVRVDAPRLEIPRLRNLSPALRRLVLRTWLGAHGVDVSRAGVLALEGLLEARGSAACDLARGWRVLREYDLLWVERRAGVGAARLPSEAPETGRAVELPVPGRAEWAGMVIQAELVEHFRAPDPAREAYMDACCLASAAGGAGAITATAAKGSLQVRGLRPGDRMRPLGAPGLRKLQDILIDLRVPAAVRPQVPLVTAGHDIVWVCGLVVGERGRITADTAQILRLSLVEAGDAAEAVAGAQDPDKEG